MIVEYSVVRDDVVHPARANPSDAGLDVFYNPEQTTPVYIEPGGNAILATGLKFGIPHGYMLQVMNRSSVAAKQSLIVGAHCIDSGYEGEVFIDLHNIGNEGREINPGDKIAQLVMVPVVSFRPFEAEQDELYEDSITISDRGEGSLGSTNATPKQQLTLPLKDQHPLSGQPSGF